MDHRTGALSEGRDFLRRLPLEGEAAALAEAIRTQTGSPGPDAGSPLLRARLRSAFPRLPEPEKIEGCTTHPALTVRLRVPGLNREAAKVVLLPLRGELEVRLRMEVPQGSYRKETLIKLIAFLEEIEEALERPRETGCGSP